MEYEDHVGPQAYGCDVCGNWFPTFYDYQAHWDEDRLSPGEECMSGREMGLMGWTRADCGCWLQPVVRVNASLDSCAGCGSSFENFSDDDGCDMCEA